MAPQPTRGGVEARDGAKAVDDEDAAKVIEKYHQFGHRQQRNNGYGRVDGERRKGSRRLPKRHRSAEQRKQRSKVGCKRR